MNLKKIAGALDLSVGTISLCLNDSPLVKKSTKKKVKEFARLTNYRPNFAARSLQNGKSFTIGIVIPQIFNPYWAEITDYTNKILAAKNYAALFVNALSTEQFKKEAGRLLDRNIDGLIFFSEEIDEKEIIRIQNEKIPVVLHGHFKITADCVEFDVYKGGCLATAHLINLGHKKIGFIGKSRENEARFKGYKDTLFHSGLPFNETWVTPGNELINSGYTGMKKILALTERPSAFFIHNDFTAMGALKAIHETDLKVPQDIALVGFDDIEESKYLIPALTTIHYPKKEICEKMVEFLLKRIEKKGKQKKQVKPKKYLFEPKLVIRDSCGAKIKERRWFQKTVNGE